MDTAAGNIVAVSILAGSKFLDRLVGPSADAAGVWIRDEIKRYLGMNVAAVASPNLTGDSTFILILPATARISASSPSTVPPHPPAARIAIAVM